jgi:hypothetical protein
MFLNSILGGLLDEERNIDLIIFSAITEDVFWSYFSGSVGYALEV